MATAEQQRSRPRQTSYFSSFIRWLQLKKYQYEVTFSLYMLTSTEKFIFNFILIALFTMLVTAAIMYLPNHVALICNRIWYYIHGEFANITGNGSSEAFRTSRPETLTSKVIETTDNVMRKLNEL